MMTFKKKHRRNPVNADHFRLGDQPGAEYGGANREPIRGPIRTHFSNGTDSPDRARVDPGVEGESLNPLGWDGPEVVSASSG